jgi:hypothetical protein
MCKFTKEKNVKQVLKSCHHLILLGILAHDEHHKNEKENP